MKQLSDFDLSIIMPFDKQLDGFKRVFPLKAKYYERNGIEVVLVADEQTELNGLLDYIRNYPFINWKIVGCTEEHQWQNPAKSINVGIRHATKKYVLVMHPELEFYTDVIFELREKLDSYPEYYAVGQILYLNCCEEINDQTLQKHCHDLIPYGSIMAKKKYFEFIGGYEETYLERWINDENLRRRLELAGIRQLFIPNAILICRTDFNQGLISKDVKKNQLSSEKLSKMFLPINIKIFESDENKDCNNVVYDWREHPYAKEQCHEYLSTLKQYDINSEIIFENSYPLIALIPTYNESDRILECLHSVEKYCDGIILLDDDSNDDTYQIAQSSKLLVKAKKYRNEFNDRQNRNILLNIASFFKAEWFIYIDADERFDDRFVDLKEVIKKTYIDLVSVWIANLWDDINTYRIDMEDTHPLSQNGLWFRWRMFRNKGRMQLITERRLHFKSVPYSNEYMYFSKTLLLHFGYIDINVRNKKYQFYKVEDKNNLFFYDDILLDSIKKKNLNALNSESFIIKKIYEKNRI